MADRQFEVEIPIRVTKQGGQNVKDVNNALTRMEKNIRRINKVGKDLNRIGGNMRTVGRQMTIAGAAVIAPLALATKQAADFEARFGRISTLFEGDARTAINMFGEDITKLSIRTGKSSKDLQDSLFDIISAGVPVGESMQFLERSALASVGAFADVQTVVDGTTAVLNAYEKPASDILQITDQISIANEVGKTTFEKLSASIGNVAASTAQLGVSSGDMLASLAAVTKVTGRTEEAVTGLQALMTLVANPTEDAAKELDRLNRGLTGKNKLIFSIKALQDEGLLNWFQKLIKVTKGDAESINKLTGSNVRASRFLRTLISQKKVFVETSRRMNDANAQGTLTMENFNNAQQLASVRIDKIKQRFAAMGREVGMNVLPILERLEPRISKILKKGFEWMKANKQMTADIVAKLAKVGIALIGAGGISFALGIVTTGVGRLITVIAGLGKVLTLLAAHPAVAALLVIGGVVALLAKKKKELTAQTGTPESRKAFNDALNEANRKAQGIDPKKRVGPVFNLGPQTPTIEPLKGIPLKDAARLQFSQKQTLDSLNDQMKAAQNKIVKNAENFQNKLTKVTKTGVDKRNRLITTEQIDIFARGEGKTLTDIIERKSDIERGFALKAINAQRAGERGTRRSKVININTLNLPNVRDPEGMATGLDKVTEAEGLQ